MSKNFHREQIKRFLLEEKFNKEPEVLEECAGLCTAAIIAGIGALGYSMDITKQFDYSSEWKSMVDDASKDPEAFKKLFDEAFYGRWTSDDGAKAAVAATMAAIGKCKDGRSNVKSYSYCKKIKKIIKQPLGEPELAEQRKYSVDSIMDSWSSFSAVQSNLKRALSKALPKLANFKLGPPPEGDGDDEERTGPKPSAKKSTRPLKKVNFKVIEAYRNGKLKALAPQGSFEQIKNSLKIGQQGVFTKTNKGDDINWATMSQRVGGLGDDVDFDSQVFTTLEEINPRSAPSGITDIEDIESWENQNPGAHLILKVVGAGKAFATRDKKHGIIKGDYGYFSRSGIKPSAVKSTKSAGLSSKCPSDLLKQGCRGENVKTLQSKLKELGYNLGSTGPNRDGVDGIYGSKTKEAVRDFQKDDKTSPKPLVHDGIAGEKTLTALKNTPKPKMNEVLAESKKKVLGKKFDDLVKAIKEGK